MVVIFASLMVLRVQTPEHIKFNGVGRSIGKPNGKQNSKRLFILGNSFYSLLPFLLPMLKRTFFIFFCLHLFLLKANAQFINFSIEEGLPSIEVYQLLQDQQGYIWFATNKGVSKFNGYEFTNYTEEDGLVNNIVFNMYEDHYGRIWFSGYSGTTSYYEQGGIHPYPYNEQIKNYFGESLPCKVSIGENDIAYFASPAKGLLMIDPQGNVSHKADSQAKSANILPIGDELIVYGSANKVSRDIHLNFYNQQFEKTQDYLSSNTNITFQQFISGDINNLIVSVGEVLFHKKAEEIHPKKFDSRITACVQEQDGSVWIGQLQKGVCLFKDASCSGLKRKYLEGFSVTFVLKDHQGGYWFSTLEEGVFYLANPKVQHLGTAPNGLAGKYISDVATDESHAYVLFKDRKLQVFSKKDWNSTKTYNLYPYSLNSIPNLMFFNANDQRLWISAVGRLNIQTGHVVKQMADWKSFPYVNAICNLNGKQTLIGNSLGYLHLIDQQSKMTIYQKSTNKPIPIRHLYPINNKQVLVGNQNGLSILDLDTQDLQDISGQSPLYKSYISQFSPWDSGVLVATRGNGCLYYSSDTVFSISKKDGLSSSIVNSVIGKGNQWFVATNKGLDIINFDAEQFSIKNYNKVHGLYANDIAEVVQLSAHQLLLVYYKAMDIISIEEMSENTIPCPIYIQEFEVNHKAKSLDEPLPKLEYDENFIQIKFTGINYKQRTQTNYRYRLLEIESEWITTHAREIQFPSLNPGAYEFQVQVANEDGLWSDTKSLHFFIRAPFWQRWWFYFLVIAFLSGSIWFALRFRIKQIKYRESVKRQMLELHQQTLNAQMNPHFIFNALNSIYNFILKNDKMMAAKYLSKFANLIRLILSNSQKGSVSLKDELKALGIYMELEKIRFRDKFEFDITIDPQIKIASTQVPTLLIQPFVENAIWHGFKNIDYLGKINIEFKLLNPETIQCIVIDNGVGRAKAKTSKITTSKNQESMGISVTEKRLQLLNETLDSQLQIIDLVDEHQQALGTRVEFLIHTQTNGYESNSN